ncbi:MAG: hypothetical protein H8E44_39860 [Planctomycetes bacterium]|nr:hypothetical protein [Planctomycetota bacterium]MBL7042012.1 hypothetical protein [Pirellulaceae bacterium]
MKHFEFETYVDSDQSLKIPSEFAGQIERDRPVRVVVLVSESQDDHDWSNLTAEQFLQGYSDKDAIYDDLSAG